MENQSEDFLNLYAGYDFLNCDSDLAQVVLDNYCTYYTDSGDRATMNGLVWSVMKDSILAMIGEGCITLNVLLADILSNDGTSNELLNALYTLDNTRFDNIYTMLGGPPFPLPTLASKIAYMRSFPNSVLTNQILIQYLQGEVATIINGLSNTLLDNTFDGTYDFCVLLENIAGCDYDASWFDFVLNNVEDTIIKNVIIQSGEPFYMCNLVMNCDDDAINKVISINKDLIADALREMDDLDITKYLMYIYKQFGRTMFNNILSDIGDTIQIQRSLTLNELHIYGSSRHGIHKPKRLVVKKNYELSSVEETGEFNLSAATDSTMYTLSYHYFKRTLTYKQYELTNHLGNVLASVLDRKTFVQDTTGQDTLLYYKADVSTAGLYYAFGSPMPTRSWTDPNAKYKYGFNGKEKDQGDEGMGGGGSTYDYGFRIYNPNLGRFLGVDPLSNSYPWYTPYQFAGNMPIAAIDLDGLEEAICIEIQTFGATYMRFYSYVDIANRVDNIAGTYMHLVQDGWKIYTPNKQKFLKASDKDKIQPIVQAPAVVQNNINQVIAATNGEKNLPAKAIQLEVKSANIKFDVNVSTVANAVKNMSTETKNELQKFAVILYNMPTLGLDIQGFADAQNGKTEAGKKNNQLLSDNRAEAAKTYINNFLKEKGVSQDKIDDINKRMYTKGNGQVNDGTIDNPANRRVDVKLINSDDTTLTQHQGEAALPKID